MVLSGENLIIKDRMRKEDKIALEIDSIMRKRYSDLSERVGLFSNVVGVFYASLMSYFYNYCLIKHEKDICEDEIKFPALNSKYVHMPFEIEFTKDPGTVKSFKGRISEHFIELISKLLSSRDTVSIGIGFNREQKIRLASHLLGKRRIYFESNIKCYIKDKSHQISFLKDLIKEIAILLNVNNRDVFTSNFINYAAKYITEDKPIIDSDILLVVSNATLQNRINSANYMYQNRKVINFAHGESCFFTFNEPTFGYSEFSYCNYCITYGEYRLDYSSNNKPLNKSPIVLGRTSEPISKYYKGKIIKKRKLLPKTKVLYVPTNLKKNKKYSPCTFLEHSLYKKWQEAILSVGFNITCKVHPRAQDHIDPRLTKPIKKDLRHCLHEYDFYLLDFISTASALLMATERPIIYFDLGRRILHESAQKDMKKRVFWVDINLNRPFEAQIRNAIKNYNNHEGEFVNEYTEKYSLSKNRDIDIIDSIINDNVQKRKEWDNVI